MSSTQQLFFPYMPLFMAFDHLTGRHYPRTRNVLLAVAAQALLGSVSLCAAGEASAQPNYSEIRAELAERGLRIVVGKELAGGDDAKEFLVMKGDQVLGRLYTLEDKGQGYVDQMIVDGDNPQSFATMAALYERENPGTEVVLLVAGAFSCRDDGCNTTDPSIWEPDGTVYHDGVPMGWPQPNPTYGGLVTLDPQNNSVAVSPRVPGSFEDTTGKEIFQAFTLIENGVVQKFHPGPQVPRRALIERNYIDSSGTEQTQWCIFNLDQGMDLNEFAEFLSEGLGVRNAALLDTGSHGLGWVNYAEGEPGYLLTIHPDELAMPNFTSVLVLARRN